MTSYERRGAGDPIVLVHGLGSRWEVWEPILDRLAEQHDVIAVDLPGFGQASLERGVQPGAVIISPTPTTHGPITKRRRRCNGRRGEGASATMGGAKIAS